MSKLRLFDNFKVEQYRNGILIAERLAPNMLVNEFLTYTLNKLFKAGTVDAYYVGLIDSTGYVAIALTDVAAQINGTNGWDENVDYIDATRQPYVATTTVTQSIDNSASKAQFTMVGSGSLTLKGAFLCTSAVKSGTAGTLVNAALFSGGNLSYVADDLIQVTATFADENC